MNSNNYFVVTPACLQKISSDRTDRNLRFERFDNYTESSAIKKLDKKYRMIGLASYVLDDDTIAFVGDSSCEIRSNKEFKFSDKLNRMFGNATFQSVNLENIEFPVIRDCTSMFESKNLTGEITFGNKKKTLIGNINRMFAGCPAQRIDLTNIVMKPSSVYRIFSNCRAELVGLDKVKFCSLTNMRGMFANYQGKSIDIRGLPTGNTTDFSHLFDGCRSAKVINLDGIDTHNAKNMASAFRYCTDIKKLDVSGLITDKVTNMRAMFADCHAKDIDMRGFRTANVKNMAYMFNRCHAKKLELQNFCTVNTEDMTYMFYGCLSNLIDIRSFHTGSVKRLEGMFRECKASKILLPPVFDLTNVNSISAMFLWCSNVKRLDLRLFNTGYLKNMCYNLESIDLSGCDTRNVVYMQELFSKCKNLRSVNLDGISTIDVKDMSYMFKGCMNLNSLNLSKFDTTSVESMQGMFENIVLMSWICQALTQVKRNSI